MSQTPKKKPKLNNEGNSHELLDQAAKKGKGLQPNKLANKPNLPKDWTRGEKLAEGGFAAVYLATNNANGEQFVVKSVDSIDYEKKLALFNEMNVLKGCNSPYIVKFLGFGFNPKPIKRFDLFLEFVPRGTVLDHVQREVMLQEPIVAAYTRDILKGLHYLHQRRIIHGDIKNANLLVAPNSIKLCDLGSAKFMDKGDLLLAPRPGQKGRRQRIFVTGTPNFMAPEVEDEIRQDYASDIYSLGCTIVEMATGDPPQKDPALYGFEADPDDEEYDCTMDVPPNFSQLCRDFVELCLTVDPDQRPGTEELLDHPWIVNAPPYPAHKPRKAKQRTGSVVQHMSNWMGCGAGSGEASVISCLRCSLCQCVVPASKDDMDVALLNPKMKRKFCACGNQKHDEIRRKISHIT